MGITAQDFFAEQAPVYDEQYKGRLDVYATEQKLDAFFKDARLLPEDVFHFPDNSGKKECVELLQTSFDRTRLQQ